MSNLTLSKDGCRESEREECDALDVFKLTRYNVSECASTHGIATRRYCRHHDIF